MFYTKKWGMVSSKAELYMLAHAEHEFERKRKEAAKYEAWKGLLSTPRNRRKNARSKRSRH